MVENKNENPELSLETPDLPFDGQEKNGDTTPAAEVVSVEETVSAEEAAAVSETDQPSEDVDATEDIEENAQQEQMPAASTESDESPSEEMLPEQVEPTKETPAVPEGVVRYRWNYETQRATDEQRSARKHRSGILTYAIVMTAFFAVSFTILIASLLTGGLVGREGAGGNSSGSATVSDRIVYIREDDGSSGILTIQEIAAKSNPGVVAVSVKKTMGQGVGTGFVLSEDGYIATNYHVVENGTTVRVTLYDGSGYDATVVNYSEPDDLAVLKIDAKKLPVLPIGNSDEVLVGDTVVVIGHPAGLEYGWSTTNGILSAINREVKIKNTDGTLNKKMTLLQTNANVNSGNSGGPMFNERGEVIGIISMKLADGYEGMGFAIPINGAMEIINAIIEKGHADDVQSSVSEGRPMLGVSGFDVLPGMTVVKNEDGKYSYGFGSTEGMTGTFYPVERAGFYIIETVPGGDAHGKLQPHDLIFAVDGVETPNRAAMMAIMNEKSIGDSVVIDFLRDGEVHSLKIKLTAEQPTQGE